MSLRRSNTIFISSDRSSCSDDVPLEILYGVSQCYGVSASHVTHMWVTRPERPKGAKDEDAD